MRIEVRGKSERTCPYCRDTFGEREAAIPCLRCGVLIHEECAEELSLCPLLGCGGRFRQPQRPPLLSKRRAQASPKPWVFAALGLGVIVSLCVGLFGDGDAERQARARKVRRREARRTRIQVFDTRRERIDLTPRASSAEVQRGRVRIQLPARPRDPIRIVVQAGDVFDGHYQSADGDLVPCRLVAAEAGAANSGQVLELRAVFLGSDHLEPPREVQLDWVRPPNSRLSEERLASRVLQLFAQATPGSASWQTRLAAYRVRVHDLGREALLGHLPLEEREVVLQGAYDLLRRHRLLPRSTPRALRGFVPLRDPASFLPASLRGLEPYESFLSLRRAKDPARVEELVHAYAELPLSPAQARSLARLHRERGDRIPLNRVLQRLERAETLSGRLLWIEHVRAYDRLLARGLEAVHAEDGLLGLPEPPGAARRKVAAWEAVAGETFLEIPMPSADQATARDLIRAEEAARAHLSRRLVLEAEAGRPGSLVLAAAHVPGDPRVRELCRSRRGQIEAVRAQVWLARAEARPDFSALVRLDSEARQAAALEAAFALEPRQRELLWHALIEAGHPRAQLIEVLARLREHGRDDLRDLGAWCALVHDDAAERQRLLARFELSDPIWSPARASLLDPRGWAGVLRVVFRESAGPSDTANYLLREVVRVPPRLQILEVYAEGHGPAAARLAIRNASYEPEAWRERAIELASQHLEREEAEAQVERGLRDRSERVRLCAAKHLRVFALRPGFLSDLAERAEPAIAKAAWLQLATSDVKRAAELGRGWAGGSDPARTALAFELAQELRLKRPTLARALLQELAARSHDPAIRRQAAALLR